MPAAYAFCIFLAQCVRLPLGIRCERSVLVQETCMLSTCSPLLQWSGIKHTGDLMQAPLVALPS